MIQAPQNYGMQPAQQAPARKPAFAPSYNAVQINLDTPTLNAPPAMPYYPPVNMETYKPQAPANAPAQPEAPAQAPAQPTQVPPPVLDTTQPQQPQVQQPTASASKNSVKSPLPGTISAINVKVGAQVKRGDTLIVMEAMKMENNIMASSDGQVKAIHVTVGQSVAQDDPLIDLA